MAYEHTRRVSLLWWLVAFVIAMVGFAAVFEIDQAVRAQGQVITDSRTQVVQTVDGGMLTALYVREGDQVRAGQALAEFERDRALANYNQAKAEVASRSIAIIRAQAELTEQSPDFSAYQQAWPTFVAVQQGIYTQRKRGLDEEVMVLNAQLRLARQELTMSQNLQKNGDISQTEVMRAEREVLDLQARINAANNKYFQDSRLELAKLQDDLSASENKRLERENILNHTQLVAPMDGVVKFVRITTLGGVLKPGDELMQISPLDDELLVEIKLNPMDVSQVAVGLPVTLGFDALDPTIFGKVPGQLRYISPDTLNEQGSNGQETTYYRAIVAIDWTQHQQQRLQLIQAQDIKPGMTATADVLTGKRSLLHFIFKPITRAFSGALIQR